MSIRFSDLQMWNDTMIPQPCADSRRWLVLGRRDRCPFGSCPASHFWIDLRWWFDSLFSSCETPTVQLCCCVFDKAWPTDPIGSSQEQRLHATIAILGSVSSAQNVSRASWKLLEEDVTTYQERLGSYLKKMLRRIKSVLEVTWRRCYDVSRASWMLLEEDVTTYQERLGSYLKKMLRHIKSVLGCYLKKMLRRIKSVLEVTWRRCCGVSRAS